jgi:hypothetical protein
VLTPNFLDELSQTGIVDGRLHVLWQPSDNLPQALQIPGTPSTFQDLLKDTRDTATFAVVSPRCLTYGGWDERTSRYLERGCGAGLPLHVNGAPRHTTWLKAIMKLRKRNPLERCPILATTICINPEARPEVTLPLESRTQIRLVEGVLDIRSWWRKMGHQLASYERRKWRTPRYEEQCHRQSMQATSTRNVALCVMDHM